MEVQVFGLKNDSETRKAQRFFAERRVKVHFVDLQQRPIAPGELKRFVQKLGVTALVNTRAKRYADLGLAHQRLTEERWIERLCGDPALLLLPLARCGQQLTIGAAEATWKAWVEESKA
jgi:arsenate reductase-like glutaredoxin family protein